jgi:hypothetical protein
LFVADPVVRLVTTKTQESYLVGSIQFHPPRDSSIGDVLQGFSKLAERAGDAYSLIGIDVWMPQHRKDIRVLVEGCRSSELITAYGDGVPPNIVTASTLETIFQDRNRLTVNNDALGFILLDRRLIFEKTMLDNTGRGDFDKTPFPTSLFPFPNAIVKTYLKPATIE